MARVATLAAVALLAACAGAGSLEKDIEKMQAHLAKMEVALRAKKAALADEKALAAKLEAMADAVEMAADAASDTLDTTMPHPTRTPLVGEHGYAFVVVDFLRYVLEVIGACGILMILIYFKELYKAFSEASKALYKAFEWASKWPPLVAIFLYVLLLLVIISVAAAFIQVVGIPTVLVSAVFVAFGGKAAGGKARLFLDIAGVIVIYNCGHGFIHRALLSGKRSH